MSLRVGLDVGSGFEFWLFSCTANPVSQSGGIRVVGTAVKHRHFQKFPYSY